MINYLAAMNWMLSQADQLVVNSYIKSDDFAFSIGASPNVQAKEQWKKLCSIANEAMFALKTSIPVAKLISGDCKLQKHLLFYALSLVN